MVDICTEVGGVLGGDGGGRQGEALGFGGLGRRWLNQSTYSRAAYSRRPRSRHGPFSRMGTVLHRPMTDAVAADTALGGLSGHVLGHTLVTNLVRSGADVVLIAELAGYRRLDTTRRYSLPSETDRADAVESILVEQ